MADAAIADAPAAPAAAPSTPAAPAAAAVPKGIEAAATAAAKAMGDFNKEVTPAPKEPKAPDKPAPDKAKADEPAKPAKGADDLWEKAPPKLKGEYFKLKRESEERITKLDEEVKRIQAKPKESPGDAKAIEDLNKRIAQYEQKLAAADFRSSEEFKNNFEKRYVNEYKAAVEEVKQLQLSIRDGDDVKMRPATEADFVKIMRLPPGEQDKVISELFGHYAPRVFTRLMELERIQKSADEAVAERASKAETIAKEAQSKTAKEQEAYQQAVEQSTKELAQQWPEHFAPDDKDPEASGALQKGFEFVDNILKTAPSLPADERAAYNAVLRARAAAFVPATLKLNRAMEEIKQLKAELGKFRRSDPGEGEQPGGETPVADNVPKGIEAAAAAVVRPA